MKLLHKGSVSFIFAFASVLMPGFIGGVAQAGSISLNRVQITDGSRIDLFFDSKIKPKQIKTEFFNDIIQLSLSDVSVYPAKINSVSGMDLTKVFAYQYSPKLVRCRLTVKGTAEEFKNRFEIKANGKVLTLKIRPEGKDAIQASQAGIVKAAAGQAVGRDGINRNQMSAEEQQLLDRVLEKSAKSEGQTSKETKETAKKSETPKRLTSSKPLPSPWRALGILTVMVMLIAGTGVLVKKAKSGSVSLKGHKGLKSLIPFGINPKTKLIEVIASHYLGPKKSISVVRVQGRLLVLGITNEAINLIAQLPSHASQDDIAEAAIQQFEEGLGSAIMSTDGAPEVGPQSSAKNGDFSAVLSDATTRPRSRDRIKSRLEGLKQL